MRRILIILRRLQAGGIEQATITLANAMAAQGHEVHVWVLRGDARLTPDPAVHLHAGGDIEREARRGLLGSSCDLLGRGLLKHLVPGSGFVWTGWRTSALAKARIAEWESQYGAFDQILIRGQGAFELLWDLHDPRCWQLVEGPSSKLRHYRFGGWLAAKLFQDKQVICVSQGIAEVLQQMLSHFSVRPTRQTVIHNGVPLARVRQLAQLAQDPPITGRFLVHVARLVPVKDQTLLLRAFKRAELDCKLVIIGEGSERTVLERLIQMLELDERVILLGHQANPYPWVAGAEAFILSSRTEGLGLVLIEALACGTQAVATDVPGGIREVLIEEQTRLLAAHDEAALAAKMREALADPVQILPHWVDRFDDGEIARRFLALIED
ncbi:glycosyltransferase [Aeromonas molluscorum]|uniref:Group 1 glycosyl transferase n=1 Tax=Aeromonas molluscorum 848 TaxID=1268236 RepID=R1F956_9GAMM|nr:glycosyltransferase [Aeromonas molluscorum]EOD56293.1 group 1 glycosyl transferase [Aeromonas molluscorum 848]